MKKAIFTIITLGLFSLGFSQNTTLVEDQNPNYMQSQDKYMAAAETHTTLQGTTAQETYKAIDPLEEKRELRALRRSYRAQRPLWRHQRRLERIKNTQYFQNSTPNIYWNNRPFWGRRNFNNNRWNCGTNLLGLGLLGSCFL